MFQIIKKLLARDLLKFLDDACAEVFNSKSIAVFPYKSACEIVNLVMVSMLRELLLNAEGKMVRSSEFLEIIGKWSSSKFFDFSELTSSLVKEIQQFVKNLFVSGQTELSSRENEASEHENPNQINRFKLNVQTNSVCIDILVWATRDEHGKNRRRFL